MGSLHVVDIVCHKPKFRLIVICIGYWSVVDYI